MINFVILDTSIYRELGLKFHEHIDYVNLSGFCIATDCEMLLSSIVKEEFCNYYETQLTKKINDYIASIKSLQRDPFFDSKDLSIININKTKEDALATFSEIIDTIPKHRSPFTKLKHTQIDALDLTKFILESKSNGVSEIQVRDYLIWLSIIKIAISRSKDEVFKMGRRKVTFEKGLVYFITKDKGFTENPQFTKLLDDSKVRNIQVFNSIPEFLHKKGFNLAFLKPDVLLSKISNTRILKDLSKDIYSLMSYVDSKYNSIDDNREIVKKEIVDKEIVEYYSYHDPEDDKYKYVAHLKVTLNIVFEADKNEIPYDPILWLGKGLQTFTKLGQPYFNEPVLFIYKGLLNTNTKTIKSIQFVDFLPWLYIKY